MANVYKSKLHRFILEDHKSIILALYSIYIFLPSCTSPFLSNLEEPEPKPELPSKSYYLSQGGDDTNPGTREKPWRTLEKLNSVDLEPGETVYLEGGTTFPGTLVLDSADSGSPDKPVIITSYGTERAIINAGIKEAAIIKSSYFTFRSIDAKGSGRKEGNTTNGIEVQKSSNGTIEQVTIEGFQHSGLQLYSCRKMKVIKVTARSNGFSGIFVTGAYSKQNGRYTFPYNEIDCSRDITLKDCLVENNPGDPSILSNHSGNGILVDFTKGALIDHCTATNNGWDMPRGGNGPIGIWTHSSDSVIIQHCISYRNKTSSNGLDGGGFDLDGGVTNSIIQYCLSFENEGAGYGLYQWDGAKDWNNNIVRYSISINDGIKGYGGISIWNGTNDSRQFATSQVHNNVVYSSISPAVQFKEASNNSNFGFYNNILMGKGDIITGPSTGDKFLGNTYWNTGGSPVIFRGHSSLQAWADASGQEKLEGRLVGMHTDPMLTGPFTTTLSDPYQLGTLVGFRLQPNSPVKDKGLDLQTLFKLRLPAQDFYNNPTFRGISPEPGIHELN